MLFHHFHNKVIIYLLDFNYSRYAKNTQNGKQYQRNIYIDTNGKRFVNFQNKKVYLTKLKITTEILAEIESISSATARYYNEKYKAKAWYSSPNTLFSR